MVDGYNRSSFTGGTVKYKDLDISFLANPMTDDLRVKTDIDAIKQSFKNLLLTKSGERPFRPYIGGGLHHLLLEPLDEITKIQIKQAVSNTITSFEPRVRLLAVDVQENENDFSALNISITFTFVNVIEPTTITILLNRTR